MNRIISLSAFKAHKNVPILANENDLLLEFCGLVDPISYPDDFINNILELDHSNLLHTAHGPFYDLIPPSSDIEVSELAKIKFKRAIEACKKLNISKMIVHSGWIPGFYNDEYWINNSIIFWESILSYCGDEFTIYLENVFEEDPFLIKEIIDGINKNNFKICLDIGHANLTKTHIKKWIDLLSNDIHHVHLHNNFGKTDDHNGGKCQQSCRLI